MVEKSMFSGYEKFTVSSDDLSVSILSFGATITEIMYKGKNRVTAYPDIDSLVASGSYMGATIGRYANRIGGSAFEIDGVRYEVTPNEGRNQLHGGPGTWAYREWKGTAVGETSVRFEIDSPDGDEGFPGNMKAWATFTVLGSTLRIDFEGETDKPTVYAPTNHAYFNLAGEGSVLDHMLRMNSALYIEPDGELIPTGFAMPCMGEFNFSEMKPVGAEFDHCFVLNGMEALRLEAGGVAMELKTDFPAVQIYTANGMGAPLYNHAGIAIEPEFYPDSPNHPEWPSTLLRPGEHFRRYAEYRFLEA